MSGYDYDVIVVGAGSPGEHCAGELADGGLKVAVVERELAGGECRPARWPRRAGSGPGLVARIVKSCPDPSRSAGQGNGQCVSRARRPGPERDAEITSSPPMTGRGPGPDRFRAGNETVPGRHRGRAQPDCA